MLKIFLTLNPFNMSNIILKAGYSLLCRNKYVNSSMSQRVCSKWTVSDSGTRDSFPKKALCQPNPKLEDLKKITSVISVDIGFSFIGWAKIEVEGVQLTHLDHVKLPQNFKVLELNDLYTSICKIMGSIPEANAYVMQIASKNAKASINQSNRYITNMQVQALILSLLNSSKPSITDSQAVFLMKPRLYGRLYNLLVGSELVSCISVVQDLFSDQNNSFSSKVIPTSSILTKFQKHHDTEKEILGRSLLQCLAFVDLIVLRKPESFKKLMS